MKLLVVSMQDDYGEKARGPSGSEEYFDNPLRRLGHQVISFDFMERIHRAGRERMNLELLAMVREEHPDVVIFVPAGHEFMPETIAEMNRYTTTLGYFYDDSWRIRYCKFWARHYAFVTTSEVNGVKRWRDEGVTNVIYSPFACSHNVFRKQNLPKQYDVTFVGQYHPYRAWCLKQLRKAGYNVRVWGWGWAGGRVGFEEMVHVFNQSRINLNLSNNESWDFRYLLDLWRPLRQTFSVLKRTLLSSKRPDPKIREMVKARHFEINACGGFQLSYYVEGLERHYEIGEEIAIYGSIEDLVDKIKYYLNHASEREAIAQRGYERTLRDHALEQRFASLFAEMETFQKRRAGQTTKA